MNKSLLSSFTPQILDGASRCGLAPQALRQVLRAREPRIANLRSGAAKLNAREARAIELETGRSIGELALLGMELRVTPEKRAANKGLLRDTLKLMKMYADLDRPVPARRKTVRGVRGSAA
jgi:hypothetical protein